MFEQILQLPSLNAETPLPEPSQNGESEAMHGAIVPQRQGNSNFLITNSCRAIAAG